MLNIVIDEQSFSKIVNFLKLLLLIAIILIFNRFVLYKSK